MTLGNHQLHSCCRKSLMTIRFSFHSASAALRPLQEGGSVHRERWPWPTTQLCGIHRALLFWGHNPEVWRDVSLGLESQGDRGPCVLFFFFFHFLATPLGMWNQFPDQGSSYCTLQWKHKALTTGPPVKCSHVLLSTFICVYVCERPSGAWIPGKAYLLPRPTGNIVP